MKFGTRSLFAWLAGLTYFGQGCLSYLLVVEIGTVGTFWGGGQNETGNVNNIVVSLLGVICY